MRDAKSPANTPASTRLRLQPVKRIYISRNGYLPDFGAGWRSPADVDCESFLSLRIASS
jgi:hypothetical protein